MKENPFIFGTPVLTHQFINRKRELRRVVSRITTGQSIAIIGEPRSGKTSLLEYIHAKETQEALFGAKAQNLVFSYMDAMTLGSEFTQAHFWDHALGAACQQVTCTGEIPELLEAYQTCKVEGFGTFVLERFFVLFHKHGFRLVLFLDEFDTLLHHKVLNNTEFFGGLRSLASRSRGALVLVTASRQPLSILNKETQDINPTGSPYFNFLDELVLGAFPKSAAEDLLAPAKDRFNVKDRNFITQVASGHPYLLQVAASFLWEAYEDRGESTQRHVYTREELYDKAANIIDDTWRLWSPQMRKAFMSVTLDHDDMAALDEHVIDTSELRKSLPDLAPEMRALKKQGYIIEDARTKSGWRVRPEAFVWWLNDELIRVVRDDKKFEQWIREQEWGSLLKGGEKEQIKKAAGVLWTLTKESGFFKGLGEALGKRMAGG